MADHQVKNAHDPLNRSMAIESQCDSTAGQETFRDPEEAMGLFFSRKEKIQDRLCRCTQVAVIGTAHTEKVAGDLVGHTGICQYTDDERLASGRIVP